MDEVGGNSEIACIYILSALLSRTNKKIAKRDHLALSGLSSGRLMVLEWLPLQKISPYEAWIFFKWTYIYWQSGKKLRDLFPDSFQTFVVWKKMSVSPCYTYGMSFFLLNDSHLTWTHRWYSPFLIGYSFCSHCGTASLSWIVLYFQMQNRSPSVCTSHNRNQINRP